MLKSNECTVPMSFIIETTAREPIFKIFENPGSEESSQESSLKKEVTRYQKKYNAHIKKAPEGLLENGDELGTVYGTAKFAKVVAKAVLKELKGLRELMDDEYLELIREEGGKKLQKFIREKARPVINNIDPDLKELKNRISTSVTKKKKGPVDK